MKKGYTTEEFKVLCQPIVDFLNENGNPHDTVVITQTSAVLTSDTMGVPFEPKD